MWTILKSSYIALIALVIAGGFTGWRLYSAEIKQPAARLSPRLAPPSLPTEGEPGNITGIVRGADDLPVPKATVCVLCLGADPKCESRWNPRSGCVMSDSSGRFSVADVPPDRYRIAAWSREFRPVDVAQSLRVLPGQKHELAIELVAEGLPLRGTVVDLTGTAIAGARIELLADGVHGPAVVTTDEHGAFALTVPPGQLLLTANANGFAERQFSIRLPENEPVVSLLPGATISGIVLSNADRQPQPGLMVHAVHTENRMLAPYQTMTDKRGHFEFRDVAPGTYRLTSRGDHWYGIHATDVTVGMADNVRDAQVLVEPATPITVAVSVGDDNERCERGSVVLMGQSQRSRPLFEMVELGVARFPGVPAGAYQAKAICDGASSYTSPKPFHVAREPMERSYHLGRALSIRGTAMYPSADTNFSDIVAVARRAEPKRSGKPPILSPRLDSKGRFAMKGLEPGSYEVSLRPLTSTQPLSSPVLVSLVDTDGVVEVPMNRSGSLSVRLSTPDGAPSCTHEAAVRDNHGLTIGAACTDGVAFFEHVPAGELDVITRVRAHGLWHEPWPAAPAVVRSLIEPGQHAEIAVEVTPPTGTLEGAVLTDTGDAAAGVLIQLVRHGSKPYAETVSNQTGEFRFEHLDPSERFSVRALRRGGTVVSLSDIAPGTPVIVKLPTAAADRAPPNSASH